jgi:hypothetical protein
MLYCPQCGAEYRDGYSSCSDCHVLLTRERPAQSNVLANASTPNPGDPAEGPYTHFWGGDDSRLHAELCSLLDEAEIRHITIRKEDRLFRVTTQPFFELAVPTSQMEKAEFVIRDAFGEMPLLPDADAGTDSEANKPPGEESNFVHTWARKGLLPALLEKLREPLPQETENSSKPGFDPDDWFPEDATVEVWSGPDATLAEMISASLRENDIHSRTDELKDSLLVNVQPQDEARAREIVREIVEGTPPE